MTEQEAFDAWANSSPTYKAIVENPILNTFARAAWQARAEMVQNQQGKPQPRCWEGDCPDVDVCFEAEQCVYVITPPQQLTTPDMAELVEALQAAVRLAKEAFENWDSDNDSKVGKILGAMAGWSVNYHVDADNLHATLEKYGGAA